MTSHSIESKTAVLKRTLLISLITFNLDLVSGDFKKPNEFKSYDYLKKAAVVYRSDLSIAASRPKLSSWHVNVNPSQFLVVPVLCAKTGFFILEDTKDACDMVKINKEG